MSVSQDIDNLIDFLESTSKPVKNNYNYEEILQFWFGTHNMNDWTDNLRQKWFVSSNSKEQIELDDYIKNKYTLLLHSLLNNKNNLLQTWKTINLHSCLSAIIVLDQFCRHIYRKELNTCIKGQRVMIDKCDTIALQLSKYIMSKHNHLLCATFTVPQFIFCLMPYRHSRQLNNIEFVLKQIDINLNKNMQSFNGLIVRFKRATIKQMQGIQSINTAAEFKVNINDNQNFDDVLEFNGFQYENKQENDVEKVVHKSKTTRKWKKRRNNEDINDGKVVNNKLYKQIKYYLEQRNIFKLKYLFVSLSGGVDSMVITKILYFLKLFDKISLNIVAIHIDYGNRLESHKEALFLEKWCEENEIIFRKREICEIKRGVTKRDDYERLSRAIRFNTYKNVLNEFKCENNSSGIIFGHHEGDVQENVISNMMKGCSLLNISGMDSQSIINGVLIWRPLLFHKKTEIFNFAHKFGVPYFKDSTPKWSSRGRMRNELLPLLSDIFGNGFADNLSRLSIESIQFKQMAKKNIFDTCWNTIKYSQCAAWIDCSGYENYSILFWKETLKYICEDILGIARIHEKGIKRELMTKLRKICNDDDSKCIGWWLQLRREYKCFLKKKEKILFIFVPEFAPILAGKIIKYNYYVPHGIELKLIFDKQYKFGVWRIKFIQNNDITNLYNKKYKINLIDIANGYFEYFLPLLDVENNNNNNNNNKYLIDRTKAVRKLKCFRGLPHGMKEILPMVIAKGKMINDAKMCVKVCVSFVRK